MQSCRSCSLAGIQDKAFTAELECLWYLKDLLFPFRPKEAFYSASHMHACRCHSGDQHVFCKISLVKSLGIFTFLTTPSQPQILEPSAAKGWQTTMWLINSEV